MKIKEAFSVLFTVIIKVFGIAILFGLIGYSFNVPFLGMAIIGFILNFVLGTAFTYYYNHQHEKLVVEQNKRILEFQSNKTADVKCAFCHQENIVPIDLSKTKFICKRCHHTNRLIVQFSTAQITTPQSTPDMIGRGVDENEAL